MCANDQADCLRDDTSVCKDLVLEDSPTGNPFRGLLSLSEQHPMLQHIIVANAALHLANSRRNSGAATLNAQHTDTVASESSASEAYRDALEAKQKALGLLSAGLADRSSSNQEALLACIMLFVMFEMMDSETNEWRFHTEGAKQFMVYLNDNTAPPSATLKDLRSALISNCLVYALPRFGQPILTF